MTQYYRNTHKPCILYMYREDEGKKPWTRWFYIQEKFHIWYLLKPLLYRGDHRCLTHITCFSETQCPENERKPAIMDQIFKNYRKKCTNVYIYIVLFTCNNCWNYQINIMMRSNWFYIDWFYRFINGYTEKQNHIYIRYIPRSSKYQCFVYS